MDSYVSLFEMKNQISLDHEKLADLENYSNKLFAKNQKIYNVAESGEINGVFAIIFHWPFAFISLPKLWWCVP